MRFAALISVAATLVLALPGIASAREWTSKKYNCAVTIPDGQGWGPVKEDPDPEMILEMEQDDGALSFGLEVKSTSITSLTANVRAQLRQDVPGDGIETVYSKDTTVAGWPAFEVGEKAVVDGTEITSTGYYMFAGGYQYSLVITKVGGKAQEDAELRALASSFRFLSTPRQPEGGVGVAGIVGTIGGVLGLALLVGLRFLIRRAVAEPPRPRTRRRGTYGEGRGRRVPPHRR